MNHFEKFNNWVLDVYKSKGGSLKIDSKKPFTMEVVTNQGVPTGVNVDNLGSYPYLPITVFHSALFLLQTKGGSALKGDAMSHKLGEGDLPLDSIEGYIAYLVFGQEIGSSVFRKITPISRILEASGVCYKKAGKDDGYLHLAQ